MTSFQKMGLKFKVLPPILGSVLVILLIGAVLLINSAENGTQRQVEIARSALQTEQLYASEGLISALQSKADTLGLFMSKTAPDLIMSYDFTTLLDHQATASNDKDVVYAAFLDASEKPITDFEKPSDLSDIIELKYPIKSDDELLGYVLLGMSKSSVNAVIDESNSRITNVLETVTNSAASSLDDFIKIMVMNTIIVLVAISLIIFYLFGRLVIKRVCSTTNLIQALTDGNGDLTQRIPVNNDDEISQLSQSVNQFVEQLQSIISEIVGAVKTLSGQVDNLESVGQEMKAHSATQNQQTSEVAGSMSGMTESVQDVAEHANQAAEAAENADSEVSSGRKIVNGTKNSIAELASDVEFASESINKVQTDSIEIGGVLDVIRGIAEQTNLLALNAAIEAARAGEQGRGFAVVADEVRTLASRTQASTEEIQTMIERLQTGTEQAVKVMENSTSKAQDANQKADQADASLEKIAQAATTINEMNTQIAILAKDQSNVAEQINQKVGKINNVSEMTATSAEKTSNSSKSLLEIAEQLQQLVGVFRT